MLVRSALRLVATFLLLAAPLSAQAQLVDRIAAVVNDEIITIKDVDQRYRMALALSKLQDSQEVRSRVLPQVVRKMIDERLQMQEAARLKITMGPTEVDAAIASMEKRGGQPAGSLIGGMARMGIDPQAIKDQVRADFTWIRVVQRVMRPNIRVGNEEVKDRLASIQARTGQPEYLAAEIFLPIENPSQEEEIANLANRLVDQLKSGTPFQSLVGQFSRSPTAANGGQMGWVSRGMLDEELIAALEVLQPGQVSPPVRAADGLHILALINQRIAGATADPAAATVTVARIVLPYPPAGPTKQELIGRARQLTQGARSCDDLEAIGRRVGVPVPERTPPTRVGQLAAELAQVAAELPANRVSPPVETDEGLMVVMVCERQESTTVELPSEDQVRQMIEDERLDMMARRYLRDLRRAAFVEIRI